MYTLRQTNHIVLYHTGALVVKFDPAGNLLWRNMIETGSAVQRILPAPDGGAWLVLTNANVQSIEYGFSMTEVLKVSPGGSDGSAIVHGQLDGGDYDPAVWATHLFSEVAPSGDIFHAVSENTIGGTGEIQVLYKHNAAGAQLAKLEVDPGETPELWQTMKTDAAGNLYVASMFDVSETDRRICLSRYNSDLQLQWRAFGPPHSMGYNWNTAWMPLMQITPHGITLSYGSPGQGYYSEFPYEHGEFARFSTSGDLLWTRGIKGCTATVLHGDAIHSFQVDNAGNVLFLAAFNNPISVSDYHYGKLSAAGDLQFIMDTGGLANFFPIETTVLYQGTQLLTLDLGLNNAPPPDDTYDLVLFGNPANQLVPVTLDADHPSDLRVIEGSNNLMRVINRGSAATYQWRKKDGLGVPQNIPGATLDRLFLNNIAPADAGEYSVVVTNAVDAATSRTATLTVLPSVALDVALDTPGRTWTNGGSKPWVGFGLAPSHDNTDAAMPNNLGQGESSWLETTVTGPGTVSFWWKSSNPSFSDFFDFSVNGDSVNHIGGDQDWIFFQHVLGAGSHTLRWTMSKSSASTPGTNNTVFLDQVVISGNTSVPLADALDTTGRTWTTSGDAAWTGVTSPSHDGVDAAASGQIIGNQTTSMETIVTGPGTLSFWWKVSSEGGFDVLKLTVDDAPYGSASGEVSWTQITRPISAGTHVVRWTYSKDAVFNGGQDRAWVDEVIYESDAPQPPVVTTTAATLFLATTATLNANVNPKNVSTTVSFEYGTAPDSLTSTSSTLVLSAGNSSVPVSRALTGLIPQTTYYFRVKAVSTQGTSYGDVLSFTTSDLLSSVPEISVEQPVTVNLTDDVSPVDFGSVGVKDVSVRQFTIRNSGAIPLTGLGISFDGTNPGDFTLIAAPVAPVAANGGSTTFTVQFKPSTTGSRTAKLHIASNDADENPFDIPLNGIGTPAPAGPEIVVEHPLYTPLTDNAGLFQFGDVATTGTSTLSFTVRSVGGANLTKIAATITGSSSITVTTKPAASLTPGNTTQVTVSYKSSTLGAQNAVLKIASDDADENPFEINLSGNGIPPTRPAFTLSPVSQMLAVGMTANFSCKATGNPAPTLQWRKGTSAIAKATFSQYSIPNAGLAHAGPYNVQAKSAGITETSATAELGVVEVVPKSFILASDGNISFTCNAAGTGLSYLWKKDGTALDPSAHYVDVTKKTLTIKKLVTDDNGIYTCQVTGAAGVRSSGNHTLTVFDTRPDITPLANGNALPPGIVSRSYSYQVPVDPDSDKMPTGFAATNLPPGLQINGAGLISGIPTAAKTGTGGAVLSYSVKITASNTKGKDEVTVNLFIAPLPEGAVGVFEGPIVRSSTLNGDLGGRFDLTTKTTGSFSGNITLGTDKHGFAGVLSTDALGHYIQGTASITRKGLSTLMVNFTMDTANQRIDVGEVIDGPNRAAFTAWRNTWTTTNKPDAFDGYYTLALDMQTGRPDAPQGTGYGSFKVDAATGKLSLLGKLADGEGIAHNAFVGPQGQILVFQLPYKPTSGALAGSMTIGLGTNTTHDSDNTLSGILTLSRPANSPATTRTYKDGFSTANITVGGGRFTAPALVLGVTAGANNARLVFSEAGIGVPAPTPDINLGIGAANAISYPASNPRSTTLKLTPATGFFNGTFYLEDPNPVPGGTPNPVKRSIKYEGVIIQDGSQQRGYGWFLLPQLPNAGPPATNTTNSPQLSGQVLFERL